MLIAEVLQIHIKIRKMKYKIVVITWECKIKCNSIKKIKTSNWNCSLVRGANGSLVVRVSPLVAVSKSTNDCRFIQEKIRKIDNHLSKAILRLNWFRKGYGFMYNRNIKPIYNYNLQECNLLFKKGIHPIGCGVGDRDGRVYHVFMADRRYFDAVKLIQYENTER